MVSSLEPGGGLINLGDDRVADALELLLHGLKLLLLSMVSSLEPGGGLINLGLDSSLVLSSELLSLTHHALNVVLGETALVVSDGNVGLLARGTLVLSRDVQHTVGINIEGDLDLRNTTRSRRDAS